MSYRVRHMSRLKEVLPVHSLVFNLCIFYHLSFDLYTGKFWILMEIVLMIPCEIFRKSFSMIVTNPFRIQALRKISTERNDYIKVSQRLSSLLEILKTVLKHRKVTWKKFGLKRFFIPISREYSVSIPP